MSNFKCACGQTQANITGTPFALSNCFCHSCVASCRFIDAKADGKGTSQLSKDGGASIAFFGPTQVKFVSKPAAGFGGVKVGEKGKAARGYSKCCNSSVFFNHPKFFTLNLNCIYNDDGSKYVPENPVENYQRKFAFDPSSVPEPAHDTVPLGDMWTILKRMFIPWGPKITDKDLFYDTKKAEVVPITWE